jgi:heat shock protein HtpX
MDYERVRSHRTLNLLQSLVILAGMTALLATVGWLIAGVEGMLWTAAAIALALALSPRISPSMVLRLYATRILDRHNAPGLYALAAELARRAGLPAVPTLHYLPSRLLNAFAVGRREHASVVLSDALLRELPPRELAGVLAHEISHIANDDMWVMGLADAVSRLTSMLSLFGQILLLVSLPILFFGGDAPVPLLALLLLVAAPTLSALLQLALSRTREYQADVDAVRLTGDARGLASALVRLEQRQGGWIERVILPGRGVPDPSLLRTHPPTQERVRRLLELQAQRPEVVPVPVREADWRRHLPAARALRRPRWRAGGMWY